MKKKLDLAKNVIKMTLLSWSIKKRYEKDNFLEINNITVDLILLVGRTRKTLPQDVLIEIDAIALKN